jgi:hypothetical protein
VQRQKNRGILCSGRREPRQRSVEEDGRKTCGIGSEGYNEGVG